MERFFVGLLVFACSLHAGQQDKDFFKGSTPEHYALIFAGYATTDESNLFAIYQGADEDAVHMQEKKNDEMASSKDEHTCRKRRSKKSKRKVVKEEIFRVKMGTKEEFEEVNVTSIRRDNFEHEVEIKTENGIFNIPWASASKQGYTNYDSVRFDNELLKACIFERKFK